MTERFIGLMSGTSLDGVDAVLAAFDSTGQLTVEADFFVPYPSEIRDEVLALQPLGHNELDRSARLAVSLAGYYARAVNGLLLAEGLLPADIRAIGCHGQTIRHAPHAGYTLQIGDLALLAELSGIDVAGDFRSRDIAAGGQGAPLVPAFHQNLFSHACTARAIVNIGGISNLTRLAPGQDVVGFDCGPGNMLMDAWIRRHLGQPYDKDGAWAVQGHSNPLLLGAMLAEPYFSAPIPKSTGRDLFDLAWLEALLGAYPASAVDVQATLLELTAVSIANATLSYAPTVRELYLCGGGAFNLALRQRLAALLPQLHIKDTSALGLPVHQVEAAAFAWLARQLLLRQSGNLPSVTGAYGARVLGALYPR
ncbi:anhydro-N-acetylmuramic acid kinase [Craterilacuibacter sp.]|uniref:anhydro-N-acetylmuramic acid kinase n=1 Tax=Craterilacuibacter sp. TaxID=2870909 RepID=UPI003F31E03E